MVGIGEEGQGDAGRGIDVLDGGLVVVLIAELDGDGLGYGIDGEDEPSAGKLRPLQPAFGHVVGEFLPLKSSQRLLQLFGLSPLLEPIIGSHPYSIMAKTARGVDCWSPADRLLWATSER
jgi:hypothetical protein